MLLARSLLKTKLPRKQTVAVNSLSEQSPQQKRVALNLLLHQLHWEVLLLGQLPWRRSLLIFQTKKLLRPQALDPAQVKSQVGSVLAQPRLQKRRAVPLQQPLE